MQHHFFSQKSPFSSLVDISGKKITLMGLGLNGGGLATLRFFLHHGAIVLITDMKNASDLQSTLDQIKTDTSLDQSRIFYRLGEHIIEDFVSCDVVIKNPGVKFEGNPYLQAAVENNIPIETDISLFLRFTKSPIIAITGSKGKSSSASAIHYGLQQAGCKSFLGGNITVSPLTFLDETTEATPVVLELSSWQLSDLRGRKILKPKIAILTTIIPDHQNWYGNMENYVADKKLIYADQAPQDITICKYHDEWGDVFASQTKATVYRYATRDIFDKKNAVFGGFLDEDRNGFIYDPATDKKNFVLGSDLLVQGEHMRENLLVAALVMHALGIESEKIAPILAKFSGIQHRLEYFHEYTNAYGAAYRFYNDSAATVPEACVAAINAFKKPILICGGTDKNLDFTPFEKEFSQPQKIYLLAGSATDKILKVLKNQHFSSFIVFDSLENLLQALKKDLNELTENANIIFSPGATSFGMFQNEFDRGNQFKRLVLEIF
ncbi:MAG: UDP-N-acetylmuramoyl-L-alanine--D-glutamate ligase [Treponemataceae bacterium]